MAYNTKRTSYTAFSLNEMVQHYAQSGKTGCFLVTAGDFEGRLFISEGSAIYAETPSRSGESAAVDLLSLPSKKCSYEWIEGRSPEEVIMTIPIQDLLLRAIVVQNKRGSLLPPSSKTLPKSSTKTRNILDPNCIRILTLEISSEEIKPFRFVIKTKQVTVGRDESNNLCLPDTSVSRKHALIINTNDTIVIKDLGSMNGTYIDGQIVTEGIVRKDQLITFGEVNCKLNVNIVRKVPTLSVIHKKI